MTLPANLSPLIADTIQQHRLPASFASTVETWFWPLAQALAEAQHAAGRSLAIGINGSQGSGKSTLADFLAVLLQGWGRRCAVLSIDDLYLTKAQRQQLASSVHPLLATRGVPGTHDVELGLATIEQLLNAADNTVTTLPRFNKAIDDRLPTSEWPQFQGRADIVILEGWCVGARPQSTAALAKPINTLEMQEDPQGIWRNYANNALHGNYQTLFNLLDWQIMLAAPSFDCVYQWRKEQEAKLAARVAAQGGDRSGIMDDHALQRFIQHYERITRQLLRDMPPRTDWLFTLSDDHRILAAQNNRG